MEKQIAQLRLERGKLEQTEALARTGQALGLVEGGFGMVLSFSEWHVMGLFMVGMGLYLSWYQGRIIRRIEARVMALNARIMELRGKLQEERDAF